jgi:outer membrane protein
MKNFTIALLFLLSVTATLAAQVLTLDESIKHALENNLRLQVDRQNVNIAEQNYREIRSSILPQINFNGGYQLNRTVLPDSYIPQPLDVSGSLSADATEDDKLIAGVLDSGFNSFLPESTQDETRYFGQIKLDQVVYLGGKLLSGIRVASIYKEWERQKHELNRKEVVFATIEMYYQGLLLKHVLEINREALSLAENHYSRVVSMHDQGLVSEFDKIRAELELMKLEPEVQEAENNFALWLENFRQHTGLEEFDGELAGQIDEPDPFMPSLEEAISTGTEQRIELYLARTYKDMREIGYQAERGNYLPNVVLSAEYNRFSQTDELRVKPDSFGSSYQVMLGVQLPIFTGFGNSAKKATARYQHKQANLELLDAEDKIELDVRNVWQNLNHVVAKHQTSQKRLELAARGLNIAESRYENQIGINLEVLDAQLEYKVAHLSYLQSVYHIIIAQTRLQKAMGLALN